MKLKNNALTVLEKVSNDGGEIETAFVERMAQLLKPNGIAAVILPSSILNKDGESFKAAREQILQNFKIVGIVQLGGNTFSETNTSTVILFLQKFNEPPKLSGLLQDSIASIFDKSTDEEQLAECSDLEIFEAYCQCIGVDKESYDAFVVGSREYTTWEEHPYFGMYCKDFAVSTEYKKKCESRTFKELDENGQKNELNKLFYAKYLPVEQEKMLCFGLTYGQSTVIITSPADNAEEKEFLGYSWTKRRGQEGIKINSLGGKLYNDKDRYDNTILAAALRNNFIGEDIVLTDANRQYVNVVNTKDMLDFGRVEFDKTIRTSVASSLKIMITNPHDKIVKISEICTINPSKDEISDLDMNMKVSFIEMASLSNDGKIVEQEERTLGDVSTGSYKYFKENDILIAKITPCMENGKCAVAKNLINGIGFGSSEYHVFRCSEVILPEYLFAFLNREEVRKIAQTNMTGASGHRRVPEEFYADTQIVLPSLEDQQKIVAEFARLDGKIRDEEEAIKVADLTVAKKFEKMFGKERQKRKISEFCVVEKGENLTRAETEKGLIPVVAGGIKPSCMHSQANRHANIVTVSASGANAGYVNFWNCEIFATDCNTVDVVDTGKDNIIFVYYALKYLQDKIFESQRGASQPHVYKEDILKLEVPIADMNKQNQFADFVKEQEEKKKVAAERKAKLLAERQELAEKYFG